MARSKKLVKPSKANVWSIGRNLFDRSSTTPVKVMAQAIMVSAVGLLVLAIVALLIRRILGPHFLLSIGLGCILGFCSSVLFAAWLCVPRAQLKQILKKYVYGILAAMLCMVFVFVATFSLLDGVHLSKTAGAAITFDEVSLLPNGYFYKKTGTYFLNPEHPPLVKDIAAIPFSFLGVKLPAEPLSKDVLLQDYAQYFWGKVFLFQSGNDSEAMIFYARLFVIIANAGLLFLLYITIGRVWSKRAGLIALFLLVTSPFVIAHGSLVTVDFMSAMFTVVALLWFAILLRNLRANQTSKQALIMTAVCLSGALLSKFSTILLLPVIFLFGSGYIVATWRRQQGYKLLWERLAKIILVFVVAICLVVAFYMPHVRNMTGGDISRQLSKSYNLEQLPPFGLRALNQIAEYGVVGRAFVEFTHGLLMVNNRIHNGAGAVYFMGHLYGAEGSGILYFPILYLAKLQIGYHVLSIVALGALIFYCKSHGRKGVLDSVKKNPAAVLLAIYAVLFAGIALVSTLQIGLRHIMPVIFIAAVLVGLGLDTLLSHLSTLSVRRSRTVVIAVAVAAWMIVVMLINFPNYLSSYNALAGGTKNGYKIAADSNYDWGQDAKRLAKWQQDNHVKDLTTCLFVNPFLPIEYYFGREATIYDGKQKVAPGSYLAVSVQQYQFNVYGKGPRELKFSQYDDNLVARVGESIFVYKVPSN